MPELFQRWVQNYPLTYTSPNAPQVCDVLGAWLLSILDGQRRYASFLKAAVERWGRVIKSVKISAG